MSPQLRPFALRKQRNMSGLVRAGTLRALATTGAQRSPLLPDVPTVAEAGYPALEFAEWFGIFVPVRTPNGTVETLSSVLRTALQTKEMQAGLANQSGDVGGLTPADFALQIKADTDRWGPIVKASGFTPLDWADAQASFGE
jgi:tripartite-type tricarboxylate transporter receptor subunit TctC